MDELLKTENQEEVKEAETQAVNELVQTPENKTIQDGETKAEDTPPNEVAEETDVVTDVEPKEEWAKETQENIQENSGAEGKGAFSQARESWANGWGV